MDAICQKVVIALVGMNNSCDINGFSEDGLIMLIL